MISGTLLQKYPSRFNAVSDMVKGSYCILTHLGCSNITCARQTLTASQLIEGAENASTFADFAFWPVIDGVVLASEPPSRHARRPIHAANRRGNPHHA
jgi:hypothetical protein